METSRAARSTAWVPLAAMAPPRPSSARLIDLSPDVPHDGTTVPHHEARIRNRSRSSAIPSARRFHVRQPHAALRDALGGRDGHPGQGLAAADERDRRRVHGRPRARPVPQGGPAGRGQDGLPRPRLRARAGREGAAGVRPPGPQPRQQRAHRRRLDGVRRRLRAAVRARGRRTPRGHDGRLPQLRAARPELRGAGLRGRRGQRAQRHPARQPPPRHGLRAADADRQALHGQRGLRRQRPRHHRDDRDPVRLPRGHRGDAGHRSR